MPWSGTRNAVKEAARHSVPSRAVFTLHLGSSWSTGPGVTWPELPCSGADAERCCRVLFKYLCAHLLIVCLFFLINSRNLLLTVRKTAKAKIKQQQICLLVSGGSLFCDDLTWQKGRNLCTNFYFWWDKGFSRFVFQEIVPRWTPKRAMPHFLWKYLKVSSSFFSFLILVIWVSFLLKIPTGLSILLSFWRICFYCHRFFSLFCILYFITIHSRVYDFLLCV